ncbi:MAG: hypothetical protein ACYDBB_26055 [Armatimonadota bacterium]
MKHITLIGIAIATAVLGLGLVTGAWAQREGGGPQGGPGGNGRPPMPPPQHASMQYGANGLFVLQGVTLTKYDAGSLKQSGSVQLGNAAGQQVAPDRNANGMPPMGPPPAVAFLITAGKKAEVLAIAGDTFYRINAQDMTVTVKSSLPALQVGQGRPDNQAAPRGGGNAQGGTGRPGGQHQAGPGGGGPNGAGPGGNNGGPGMHRMQPPQLTLQGDTLYVLRAHQLLAIDIASGKVAAQGATPGKPAGGLPPQR